MDPLLLAARTAPTTGELLLCGGFALLIAAFFYLVEIE